MIQTPVFSLWHNKLFVLAMLTSDCNFCSNVKEKFSFVPDLFGGSLNVVFFWLHVGFALIICLGFILRILKTKRVLLCQYRITIKTDEQEVLPMKFLEEVAQQSSTLHELVAYYRGKGGELLKEAKHLASRRLRSIVFAGMGTSEIVPLVCRDYLGERMRTPVVIWEAGELLHYGMGNIRDDDLIILVSQSGESIETRKVADLLRFHNMVISVTNNSESSIARWSTLDLPMVAGEESAISTKTYTNSLAVMLLLSRAIPGDDWEYEVLRPLCQIADSMKTFLAERQFEIETASEFLRDARTLYFVSRGPAMAAAKQAALTFQEGVHVFATALCGGSMRHGPFEVVGPGHYAVVFAPDGEGGNLLRAMASEMADLGSRVVLFTSVEMPAHPNIVSIVIEPGIPELFPLASAVPQELLLAQMATSRGLVPGNFRYGSKVTSRE
jgi:glucosamine--fructose-6-phosphate aminotransferase (isomerizing)